MAIRIGTAGWSIPRQVADQFPAEGTSLERYAARFSVAEINSSFHRPHRISTWERWRDSVPADFRFSVKLPKTISHQAMLRDCGAQLDEFTDQTRALGDKLAVILVQLPPKLAFDRRLAKQFFEDLHGRASALLACEPRNMSWFTDEADATLQQLQVARVAADPAISAAARVPGGWKDLRYWRLHGSPSMYRSSYLDRIPELTRALLDVHASDVESWCIFDNTASSAAAADALALVQALARPVPDR